MCSLYPAVTQAQLSFSDDFSDNLEQWELVNGSWQYWQIEEGALSASLSQSKKLSTIVPLDDYWHGMEEYSVNFSFRPLDDTDKNFVVGLRDAANFYDFHFYSGQLIVEDIRNGSSLHTARVPFTLEANKNYVVYILYSKEQLKLLIDGELVFVTDEFWSPTIYGGKFGLKISTGSTAHSQVIFDDVVVREISTADVIFKQDDEQWATEVYDHADLWSIDPTISNWGCALSSAAMLLRAYGFTALPNHEEITPATLNAWLISQEDGYVADGLLNWLALSRLSKILNQASGNTLVNLEFSYVAGDQEANLNFLKEQIEPGIGQIVSSAGHFFLVTEYLAEQHDFLLKDPLYDQQLLSEKTTDIDAIRLFTPSMTDLSYLLLVLPAGIEAILFDEQGQTMEFTHAAAELIATEDETIGDDYQVLYYSQPEAGFMSLVFTADQFNEELLGQTKLLLYQQDGTVQTTILSSLLTETIDLAQLEQLTVVMTYAKEMASEISIETVFKSETQQQAESLNQLAAQSTADFAAGKISFYLFYQLNLLINSLRDKLEYFFLLDKFLDFHQL